MYSGDSAIVVANTRGVENADTFEEDGMIELRDIGGWREKHLQLQAAELETPIQEEVKDFPEIKIGKLVMSDEEEEDMTPTTTDDSLLDDSPDNSWASININADGSVDLDFSEGETDKIEDIISLLSESSSTNDETTKHSYDSPARKRNGDRTTTAKEFCLQMLDKNTNASPKRPSTPFRPKTNPQSCNNPTCEQMLQMKNSPKMVRAATKSVAKLCNARRTYSAIELTGESTIVADLPQQKMMTNLDSTRVEVSSNSSSSTGDKGCCPYHIRIRKRNAKDDSNCDAGLLVMAPRCRCAEKNSVGRSHLALSITSPSRVMSNNPPASTPVASQPKRSLSIEDAIVQLSSPSSDFAGSLSSSSKERKLVRQTVSANRITDKTKFSWTLPRRKNPGGGDQVVTSFQTSYERIMKRPAMETQTLAPPPPPTRCYSDGNVNAMVNKLRCGECKRHCVQEQGSFTCNTCLEVHRVRNTFVLEVFADRAASSEYRHERTTAYGVRVGAGLLPVIIMFISLIVCSIVLFSDSVMSNVCWTYCTNSPAQTQRSSV